MADEGAGARPLTAEGIAAIRERAEAATPEPWKARFYEDGARIERRDSPLTHRDVAGIVRGKTAHADARFIAYAREDIPRLLAEVERLRAENVRLREWVGDLADFAEGTQAGWVGEIRAWLAAHPRTCAEGEEDAVT